MRCRSRGSLIWQFDLTDDGGQLPALLLFIICVVQILKSLKDDSLEMPLKLQASLPKSQAKVEALEMALEDRNCASHICKDEYSTTSSSNNITITMKSCAMSQCLPWLLWVLKAPCLVPSSLLGTSAAHPRASIQTSLE